MMYLKIVTCFFTKRTSLKLQIFQYYVIEVRVDIIHTSLTLNYKSTISRYITFDKFQRYIKILRL